MKVFLTELYRAFFSPGFIAALIGTVIAGILGGYDFFKGVMSGAGIETAGEISVQAAYSSMYSGLLVLVVPILCALPAGASFTEDMGSRFIREYLPRAGRKKYLFSKTAAAALSGGVSVFAGLVVMLLIFSIVFPPRGVEQMGIVSDVYAYTYSVYFLGALLVLLSGCLWSLVGGVMAAATMNKYMAYACPFILYYVISTFQERYFKTQWIFSPKEWILPMNIGLPEALACALVAIIVLGALYMLLMKRRLRDV